MIAALAATALIGGLAGFLTTVLGLGGGLFLAATLGLVWPTKTVVVLVGIGLLGGNLHRSVLFRDHLDRKAARRILPFVVAGALAGSLIAARAPDLVTQVALALVVAVAILRASGILKTTISPAWHGPLQLVAAFLTSAAGAPALLVAAILLSAGFEGDRYIAMGSAAAACMHLTQISTYASAGLIDGSLLLVALLIAAVVVAGNWLGRMARAAIPSPLLPRLENLTLAVCAVLALSEVL